MLTLHRLILIGLGAFCVVMHALLWKNEYTRETGGAHVPLDLVWAKILTAPDNSLMEIRQHGSKVGFVRWIPNLGEESTAETPSENKFEPDGMMAEPSNRTLDIEGNLALENFAGRHRFHLHMEFGPGHAWNSLSLQIGDKQSQWEIKAAALDRRIRISYSEGRSLFEHTLSIDDLGEPQKLLEQLDLPWMPLMAAGLPQIRTNQNASIIGDLPWQCTQDWLRFGHSRMRTYRLRARILDKYAVVVHVSRVGEILRAELPGDIVLVNEAIAAF